MVVRSVVAVEAPRVVTAQLASCEPLILSALARPSFLVACRFSSVVELPSLVALIPSLVVLLFSCPGVSRPEVWSGVSASLAPLLLVAVLPVVAAVVAAAWGSPG